MVQGGKKVNLQNRKVKIALGLLLAVCVIIGYRIYSNIQADKARAAKLSQVRNVAVVTAHPVRQTIVPRPNTPSVAASGRSFGRMVSNMDWRETLASPTV